MGHGCVWVTHPARMQMETSSGRRRLTWSPGSPTSRGEEAQRDSMSMGHPRCEHFSCSLHAPQLWRSRSALPGSLQQITQDSGAKVVPTQQSHRGVGGGQNQRGWT